MIRPLALAVTIGIGAAISSAVGAVAQTPTPAPTCKGQAAEKKLAGAAVERDDFSSSRHPDRPLCLSMIFSENGSHFSGSCFSLPVLRIERVP